MRVPLKWLRQYVDINLTPAELSRRLTMAGTEVSAVLTTGQDWEKIGVAEVVDVSPHPNADRLRLATVDLGGEQMTVVCGAPNVASGQKVAFARVGAELIDGHSGEPTILKAAKIRGVESAGMWQIRHLVCRFATLIGSSPAEFLHVRGDPQPFS